MERYKTVETIKRAILNEESNFEGIALPSVQRAGTDYQKASYAFLKAQEFYQKNFTNPLIE